MWRYGAVVVVVVALVALAAAAQSDTDAPLPPFALKDVVAQAAANAAKAPKPSGSFTKRQYLDMLAPVVQHFRQFQNKDKTSVQYGRIIDPYAGMEIQYSTPTFAFAGATAVASGYYNASESASLLADVTIAIDAALTALVFGQPRGDLGCAQGHCNFYTMPLMLALETLDGVVSAQQLAAWHSQAKSIDPYKAYRGWPHAGGNWAIVALTGEFLRFKLGLRDNITDIVEQLAYQYKSTEWTDNGEYQDHSGCGGDCNPMPYDHFPRKYISVMLDYGYNSTNASSYWELNRRGAWTSLLLQSPWGELPTGGRSSQHQWNEAVSCVTYELWAARLAAQGDHQSAGMFKRAAVLSLESLGRWKRPTGEWNIVKNRFDPALRHGYEGYSYYAQYNLLPASMLATAYKYSDDSIEQGASFAETGGFVFTNDQFYKVIANVGGMYVEVEMHADSPPHDSTGLTRIHHRSTDPLVTITAGAPPGPEGSTPNPGSLAVGAGWNQPTEKMVYGTIVSETPSYDPSRFRSANVLWSDNEADLQEGLWVLPYNTTGNFVLDLGTPQLVTGFRLRNTHNNVYNNCGTRDFTVEYASSDSGPWTTACSDTLADAVGQSPAPFATCTVAPTTTRFVRFTAKTWYYAGAGLNSFAVLGVTGKQVNTTVVQSLATFTFSQVKQAQLAAGASATTSLATFSVVYDLDQSVSAVGRVTEYYTVTPDKVTVTTSLSDVSDKVTGIVARFPAFLTDGQRNTTVARHADSLTVSLEGDATSTLPRTCARFTASGPTPLAWAAEPTLYYARNGFMQAYNGVASALGNVTLTVEPLGSKCK